jgi:hypothetical protein
VPIEVHGFAIGSGTAGTGTAGDAPPPDGGAAGFVMLAPMSTCSPEFETVVHAPMAARSGLHGELAAMTFHAPTANADASTAAVSILLLPS